MPSRTTRAKLKQQALKTNEVTPGTTSSTLSRSRLSSLAGQHFGGLRDLYEVMGYPRVLTPQDHIDAYLRQDLAGRIVDAFPDASWRKPPTLLAEEAFNSAWNALEKRFNLWRTFHRLDRLVGLGHYGVLLLGLDGAEPMHQPALGGNYNLIFLQPHSEATAQISSWENDTNSPRFGQPLTYSITTGVNWTGTGGGRRVLSVHHSRVIHVAERALEDQSIGVPRLERIFNRLMDLDKTLGGSAEMYWQNVAQMMAFMADADTEITPEAKQDMKAQFEEMQHRLRRFLTLQGVDAKNIAPGLQGASPKDVFDCLLKVIAGSEGIPQRILVGNEAGELASSQDESAWNQRIAERNEQHLTPNMLDKFVSAGQSLGFLPAGYQGFKWPDADTMSETGRADVALKKAQALAAYLNTDGGELVVPPETFRGWIGVDEMTIPAETELDLDETDPNVVSMAGRLKRV
jgi:hypothetical protein